ncbi:MAG TPA: hypothetical protein VK447_06840 [Myxococcaceae bacterium]|nr:hypothetical protein [Myxococcaceae bacterium]
MTTATTTRKNRKHPAPKPESLLEVEPLLRDEELLRVLELDEDEDEELLRVLDEDEELLREGEEDGL